MILFVAFTESTLLISHILMCACHKLVSCSLTAATATRQQVSLGTNRLRRLSLVLINQLKGFDYSVIDNYDSAGETEKRFARHVRNL